MSATNPRCPQCHEGDPVSGPINGVIWHECQHCDYAWSDESTNPPGTSPVYAIARDLTAALNKGLGSIATVPYGTLYATLQDGGDYRALMLCDDNLLHPDTLALWAAAFGQPADGWRVCRITGRRVARLEWPTDGEAVESGRVTWIGGKP